MDILKHLSAEETSRISKDGTPSDRMSRLANHILGQRRHVLIIYKSFVQLILVKIYMVRSGLQSKTLKPIL